MRGSDRIVGETTSRILPRPVVENYLQDVYLFGTGLIDVEF
jgi:hypothetical protein